MTSNEIAYILCAIGIPGNVVFVIYAYWPNTLRRGIAMFRKMLTAIARYFSAPNRETVAQDRAMDEILPWNN